MRDANRISVALWAVLYLGGSALAQPGGMTCSLCGQRVCVLTVTQETEDVTHFDVETKEVCIPGIKLPWECKRRCGAVRKVCVLKEVTEERKVCRYDWSVRVICTSCCRRHGLKHGANCAEIHRDQRIPFDYHSADLDPNAVVPASIDAPQRRTIAAPVRSLPIATGDLDPNRHRVGGRTVQAAAPLRLP